ncbi:MAG: hypothetical protein U9Q08_01265 [Candidatus Omnitrophota bacterium]|nr:hypothetical protein [Candidatus Omnitrophota bacterium]
MSEKLQKILQENARFEKETPYNFCDRWCERCSLEKQVRCKLYQDEIERKITCIAHGRDEDDPEMTVEVMKQQFKSAENLLEKYARESEINSDDGINELDFAKIKAHIEFAKNNPLRYTTEQYRRKTQIFLKGTFYKKERVKPKIAYDFETVAWYHTLLSVKLHRALCGFHEPVNEDEFGLYDAVAQFAICKKAIKKSVEALRKIKPIFTSCHIQISELLALLHNVHSRIKMLEESI